MKSRDKGKMIQKTREELLLLLIGPTGLDFSGERRQMSQI